MSIEAMLPLLRCPRTHAPLRRQGDSLVSDSGETYPIVAGKPVLVRTVQPHHLVPPPAAQVSQTIGAFAVPAGVPASGVCINLGSGNVPCADPRGLSIDVLPNTNVDLVAEAEELPIVTGIIDHVASLSVFEHVVNPVLASAEVRRVLKEGGTFLIDTAFMQGYHGFPSHYFNMTPQAVEAVLCDDFILDESFVPGHLTMAHSLATQLDRFLELLPADRAGMMRNLPLWAAMDLLRQANRMAAPLLSGISEFGHRSLAASFTVVGRKPAGYDTRPPGSDADRRGRLAYYAARTGVIQRHHEIDLYKKFIADRGGVPPTVTGPALGAILRRLKVDDPLSPDAFAAATALAATIDGELTAIRDEVIRAYLTIRR